MDKPFFVFRYNKPWGPDKKLRQSEWFPSKEEGATAIWLWAGARWKERVQLEEEEE